MIRMKIRNGFVSNSSSCSFYCPMCGEKQFIISDSGEEYTICNDCKVKLMIKCLCLTRVDTDED
jgi:hypothetical protein